MRYFAIASLLLAAFAGVASAQGFVEGVVFPFCYCGSPCGPTMHDYIVTEKTVEFTLKSNPDCPAWGNNACTMDIGKVEINTFLNCRFSDLYGYINGVASRTSFDSTGYPGVQMIKLNSVKTALPMSGDIKVMLEIPADAKDYGDRCTSMSSLLNTTDGAPISVAVFSSNVQCCYKPLLVVYPPPSPPPPSPSPPSPSPPPPPPPPSPTPPSPSPPPPPPPPSPAPPSPSPPHPAPPPPPSPSPPSPSPPSPSPPPPPPPPSPSPPVPIIPAIPFVDFPHTCFPGNSNLNGGYEGGLDVQGAPFMVEQVILGDQSFAFDIVDIECLEPVVPKTGADLVKTCCAMGIDKIEVVMKYECQGYIKSITVDDIPVAPVYQRNKYITVPTGDLPEEYPELAEEYKVFKVTRLTNASTIIVTLRNSTDDCSKPGYFLPKGNLWYAFFSGNAYRNNCCATYIVEGEAL